MSIGKNPLRHFYIFEKHRRFWLWLFTEERQAIIGVLEYAKNVLEELMDRLESKDRALFEDAWFSETRPQQC